MIQFTSATGRSALNQVAGTQPQWLRQPSAKGPTNMNASILARRTDPGTVELRLPEDDASQQPESKATFPRYLTIRLSDDEIRALQCQLSVALNAASFAVSAY